MRETYPEWVTLLMPDRQTLFTLLDDTPPACRCGQGLRRFEASGAGGYCNGLSLWAARRPDAGAIFTDNDPQHDVVERQWYPPLDGPYELLERVWAGRCQGQG